MKKKDWLVTLTLALCIVGLAACGGGSGGGGESASREEAALGFAECMREHGVEMEDPKPGQNITIEDDDPTTKKALAACNGKLAGAGQELSAEEDEEFREGWLAFSQCMRDEGIDLADPKFPGSGKVLLGIAGIDTTSPAFEAAKEACGDEAPAQTGGGIGVGG
jgi:predicted small secreted protein